MGINTKSVFGLGFHIVGIDDCFLLMREVINTLRLIPKLMVDSDNTFNEVYRMERELWIEQNEPAILEFISDFFDRYDCIALWNDNVPILKLFDSPYSQSFFLGIPFREGNRDSGGIPTTLFNLQEIIDKTESIGKLAPFRRFLKNHELQIGIYDNSD